MIHQVIQLNEVFPQLPKPAFEPTLTAYCADNSKEIDSGRKRPAVVICPGGGYRFTSDREAEPVALRFLSLGFQAFVLRYSVAPERYPAALLQLSAAVALVREQADRFHVDAGRIAVCGFSAGGHLACSLGVFWDEPFLPQALGIARGANRPNALVLAYPVITAGRYAHADSFDCLLGADPPRELRDRMSLENQVNDKTPPTFLWHTFNDALVPVENSLLFANALRKHGIPFELHVYADGPHGLSLCDSETTGQDTARDDFINPHCRSWAYLCSEWLKLTFGLE